MRGRKSEDFIKMILLHMAFYVTHQSMSLLFLEIVSIFN